MSAGRPTRATSVTSTRSTSASSTASARSIESATLGERSTRCARRRGVGGQIRVYFYGFDDLTALERDAVETLARVAGAEVTVSLTYEPGREALVARAEAVEELRPLARRVLELPALDRHYEPVSRAALHHLERHLFEPEPSRLDPGDTITLLEAGGERAEAELVGERVLSLLREGVAADEIAVVHRSRSRAAKLYEQVFASYGIPLSSGHRPPLAHAALGRALRGAARCALEPDQAGAADLLDYLRAPGLLDRTEVADALEADIRRRGLRTALEARESLGWELADLDSLAAAPDPARELCRLARRLLAAPLAGRAPRLDRDEELDARALASLHRAVEELSELDPDAPPLRPREAMTLLERLAIAPRPAAPGQVLLAEPEEVRARRFRAVFVCGLQEGEFPLSARPDPFLSDERRRELSAAGTGLRLRPREEALAGERYLFYAAVSRATERVFLSYRSSDEEGNLALGSPFLDDVAELLNPGWPGRRARRLLADVVWDPETAPTERERQRALAASAGAPAGPDPELRRVLGARALASIRHTRVVSAGALESYGECPVKWLVERELEPLALVPAPDPMTRGSLIHWALERLLRELGGPVTPASLGDAQAILTRLMSELRKGRPQRGAAPGAPDGGVASGAPDGGTALDAPDGAALSPGSPEVVRAGALRAIEADLRRYLEHEAATGTGWPQAGLELRFGFADDEAAAAALPALELGEGPDRVLVRGVIDRLDTDGHGHAVVRDYKSGARREDWPAARWSSDRRLQVALYMLAARDLAGLTPVGGFYQPLRGDDLRGRGAFATGELGPAGVSPTDGRSPAELDSLLSDAAAAAVELARSLAAGELTPCPQSCSRGGCSYPAICRSQ